MEAYLTLEHRFLEKEDGTIWSSAHFPQHFWESYLKVFSKLNVFVRIHLVTSVPAGYKKLIIPSLTEFINLPYYLGPYAYIKSYFALKNVFSDNFKHGAAAIMYVSSPIANIFYKKLRAEKYPFAVIVVGDPRGVFSSGVITHPFRLFFKYYFIRQLRKICKDAAASSYVTKYYLQYLYPPSENRFTIGISDIILTQDDFVKKPKLFKINAQISKLLFIGSLEYLAKGPDVLIKALCKVNKKFSDWKLTIIGDGKFRHKIEDLVEKLGLSDKVIFLGHLPPGQSIIEQLDQHDIYILPSRTEGLPRSLIEAMARALPCIGTNVGGIPELLSEGDLVKPDNPDALATKIEEFMQNPEILNEAASRNLNKAKEYTFDNLNEARLSFLEYIKNTTESWLNENSPNH